MKRTVFLLTILSVLSFVAFAQNSSTSIIPTDNPKGWIIKTRSSAYQLIITADGAVKPVV